MAVMAPQSLRLEEFSDFEFLHAVDDALGAAEWVTSADIQEVLQLEHPNPNSCIGGRLGWLRVYGVVEADPEAPPPKRWRLTRDGQMMVSASLPAPVRRAIESLDTAHAVVFMRALGVQYGSMPDTAAQMMRRSWRYGDAARRRRR